MIINHESGEADKKPIEDEKNVMKTKNYVSNAIFLKCFITSISFLNI